MITPHGDVQIRNVKSSCWTATYSTLQNSSRTQPFVLRSVGCCRGTTSNAGCDWPDRSTAIWRQLSSRRTKRALLPASRRTDVLTLLFLEMQRLGTRLCGAVRDCVDFERASRLPTRPDGLRHLGRNGSHVTPTNESEIRKPSQRHGRRCNRGRHIYRLCVSGCPCVSWKIRRQRMTELSDSRTGRHAVEVEDGGYN
jgi:hypothetical protein